MKCTNCGKEIEKDWNFCPNCKNPISPNAKNENNNIINEENATKNTKKTYIYIAIYIVSMILFFLIGHIAFYIIALVDIINAKIECQKNVLIEILFYLTIVLTVFYFILVIWAIAYCMNPANYRGCPG